MIFRTVLTLFVFLPSIAYSMDNNLFQDMINKVNTKDFVTIEKFLANDRNTYSRDPEFYVILLNYSFYKDMQKSVVVEKGKGKKGDLVLKDKNSGEEVGFIGSREVHDDELIIKSIKETREALKYFNKYFNHRLDIHLGIVHIAESIKRWDIMKEQLLDIIKVSKFIDNKWTWGSIGSMQGDPKKFMMDTVQAKVHNLFYVECSEADDTWKLYPKP